MKVYVLTEYYYEEGEIKGIFENKETAENYMFAYIIERGRCNISDDAIEHESFYFDIEEYDLL